MAAVLTAPVVAIAHQHSSLTRVKTSEQTRDPEHLPLSPKKTEREITCNVMTSLKPIDTKARTAFTRFCGCGQELQALRAVLQLPVNDRVTQECYSWVRNDVIEWEGRWWKIWVRASVQFVFWSWTPPLMSQCPCRVATPSARWGRVFPIVCVYYLSSPSLQVCVEQLGGRATATATRGGHTPRPTFQCPICRLWVNMDTISLNVTLRDLLSELSRLDNKR